MKSMITRVNKEMCDITQKLDIITFISNTAETVPFNALWVFDPVVSIIFGSMILVEAYVILFCGIWMIWLCDGFCGTFMAHLMFFFDMIKYSNSQ
jgi:hypothetical protein